MYGELRDTHYMGEIFSRDAWSRYLFLVNTLIPLVNSGLLRTPQTIAEFEQRIALLEAKIDSLAHVKRFRVDIIAMASGIFIMGVVVRKHSPGNRGFHL